MTTKMPVLFVGHGSPMNAIEENSFTKSLSKLRREIPEPKAILVVSAHWLTKGTWITSMSNPRTIHDFYGFPQELFAVTYPAPGSPEMAGLVQSTVLEPKILGDTTEWGLDHGTWSVLRHLYPEANIPVLQLSIDIARSGLYHYELGKKLSSLREQGVLILGSGNIVHNLREIKWQTNAAPYDWALEFDAWTKKKIEARDYRALSDSFLEAPGGALSVPTNDHYFPLLYVLGASGSGDELSFPFEEMQNASISMRSVLLR